MLAGRNAQGEVGVLGPPSVEAPRTGLSTTGTQRHTLTGHTSAVNAVAVAPDGTWLATSTNDATVRIWDPATGTAVTALRVAGNVQALAAVDSLLVMAGAFGSYFLRTTPVQQAHPRGEFSASRDE